MRRFDRALAIWVGVAAIFVAGMTVIYLPGRSFLQAFLAALVSGLFLVLIGVGLIWVLGWLVRRAERRS